LDIDEVKTAWAAQLGGAGEAFAQWRREHPRATLNEIEDAYDGILRGIRAEVLSEAASMSEKSDARQACAECGTLMVRRGERERHLLGKDGGTLRLARSYQTCPACGVGLFPPG
jgi:hypothetical protein